MDYHRYDYFKVDGENIMKLKVKKLGSFRGLMFRRKQKLPCLLFSLSSKGIHTWFVFYPIDAIFLDINGVVRSKVSYLKPFSIHNPGHRFSFVVEFPAGGAKDITIGDRLELEVV